jgi:hypothetical protein
VLPIKQCTQETNESFGGDADRLGERADRHADGLLVNSSDSSSSQLSGRRCVLSAPESDSTPAKHVRRTPLFTPPHSARNASTTTTPDTAISERFEAPSPTLSIVSDMASSPNIFKMDLCADPAGARGLRANEIEGPLTAHCPGSTNGILGLAQEVKAVNGWSRDYSSASNSQMSFASSMSDSMPQQFRRYSVPPPSTGQLVASMCQYGIPERVASVPFVSDPTDSKKRSRSVATIERRLAGITADLPEFDPPCTHAASLSNSSSLSHHGGQAMEQNSPAAVLDEGSPPAVGIWLTPYQLPPSYSAVDNWCRSKTAQQSRIPDVSGGVQGHIDSGGRLVLAAKPQGALDGCTILGDTKAEFRAQPSSRSASRPSQLAPSSPKYDEGFVCSYAPDNLWSSDPIVDSMGGIVQDTPTPSCEVPSSSAASENANFVDNLRLTVVSIEVLAATRGELKSDPSHDAVLAVAASIHRSLPKQESYESLVLIVTAPGQTSHDLRRRFGKSKARFHAVADETQLLLAVGDLVNSVDADILTGFEVQLKSLGYLLERAKIVQVLLQPALSRVLEEHATESLFDDQWSQTHGAGVSVTGARLHPSGRFPMLNWCRRCEQYVRRPYCDEYLENTPVRGQASCVFLPSACISPIKEESPRFQ